jgi:uncharacterized protein (TIGR02285 family)
MLALWLPLAAGALPPVIWLSTEAEPAAVAGKAAEPTPSFRARKWLIDRLDGYEHHFETASAARIGKLILESAGPYCNASSLSTPDRVRRGLLSRPLLHYLPNRLVLRADKAAEVAPYLMPNGELQFDRLLADSHLTGVVTRGRSYDPTIDALLERAPAVTRVADALAPTRMLMLGRVDWILSEPSELAWQLRTESAALPLRSYPVAGANSAVLTHVMCTRSPQGERVIAQVNRLLSGRPDRPWELPYQALLDEHERADLMALIRAAR